MGSKFHDIKYPVKVSNDYILAKHDLSAASQDTVFLIAKKINDFDFQENLVLDAILTLDAKTVQDALDTDHKNIKKILTRLRKESIDVPISYKDNKVMSYRNTGLVLRWEYDQEKSQYIIHIDEAIKPHFAQLGQYVEEINYTISNSKEHFSLRFKHSKRLYLLFRKIQFQSVWRKIYTLEELNEKFKTNYKRYADLKRRCLDEAVEEINNKTNVKILFEARKSAGSRALNEIVFDLDFKDVKK